jgi:hypothetical protein
MPACPAFAIVAIHVEAAFWFEQCSSKRVGGDNVSEYSRRARTTRWQWAGILLLTVLSAGGVASRADAQFGQLVSPGPLARAHASLEGAANCEKCHTPGRKIQAERCLACHKPVGERMRLKKGVHRDVTSDCTPCHGEHAGRDADLRRLNQKTFDHGRDAAFPLEGKHAEIAASCAKCHKARSFLTLSPACTSCHKDVHNGKLGQACVTCHQMAVAFKDTAARFDHSKTAFALVGAHLRVACEKCHVNKVYKGVPYAQCADCHKGAHRQNLGADCRVCHTLDTWKTQKIDHARTAYPLVGKHAEVPCVKCHVKPPRQQALAFDRCARCHQDPHRAAFKEDCAACHTESLFSRAKFDHAKGTKFPLTGKHEPLACTKCHKGTGVEQAAAVKVVDFRGLSTTCVSCHQDIHKAELGQACETCHSTLTFSLPNFVHAKATEFFGGRHQSVKCASCHVAQPPSTPRRPDAPVASWSFKNLSTACAACHADVHLGQVGTACETCHKIDSARFADVTFAHAKSSYQLIGRHETVECRKCHKSETGAFPTGAGTAVRLKGLSTACVSCHADQHSGQLGTACEKCHTPTTFKVASYKHAAPAAALMTGKHATLACTACHKPDLDQHAANGGPALRYKVGLACANCHQDQHQGALGKACDTCHTPTTWQTVSRAFHKTTAFNLEGRHLALQCSECHWNGVVRGTPTKCYDCHWIRRQDDRYRASLGTDCERCHRPDSWLPAKWNHGAMTGVALSAVHTTIGCSSCHTSGTFTAGAAACYSCHAKDYQAAAAPNHVAAGYSTACDSCHKPTDATWTAFALNHTAYFPLTGVHAAQACTACHKNNVYAGTPTTCVGCHMANYTATTTPNHATAGFSTACDTCHKATDPTWTSYAFNHTSYYSLVGVHATQACTACHKNNVYAGTSTTCVGCHLANYTATTTPNHAAAGYPTTCDTCHKATDPTWAQAGSFSHSTYYPLTGVHATQTCAACHKNNVYPGTPTTCVGCHLANYTATTTPNHAAAGFSTTCDTCHKASDPAWTTYVFNHTSYFALVGVHATQACTACHKNGVYAGTSTTCVGCHLANYTATTSPNHAAAGYPTTCDTCHKATDPTWAQAGSFNHTTYYSLIGVHATQVCTACHKNNVYPGTPTTCVGCHLANYNATTTPNHAAAGFSTTCDTCHSASAATWTASFDHNQYFVLAGRHLTAACTDCHKNNVYHGTPTACYACHTTDYTGTTNPNHASAGFPTTCDTCHKFTDASWTVAVFNHTTYYALVGVHATQTCAACHKNNVYAGTPSTCVGCHLANYNATTNPNHAGAGFSTVCDSCHQATDPLWTTYVFNHTWFPITSGRHAGNACSVCHTNPASYAVFQCLTCHDKATTDSHHGGRTGYQYVSAACYSCHPRGSAG